MGVEHVRHRLDLQAPAAEDVQAQFEQVRRHRAGRGDDRRPVAPPEAAGPGQGLHAHVRSSNAAASGASNPKVRA